MNSNNINEIKNRLYEYSNHPFLNKYFDMPEVSDDKILFLQAIMDQTDLSPEKKSDYCVATMLIQTALDAHDLVSNESDDKFKINKDKRQKQLNILVGDLYSGLFYELLAKLDDIPMINVLAGTIKEINERKMILYNNDIHSINQLMEELEKIESLLLEKVSEFLQVTSLKLIIGNWLLMKRLIRENQFYQDYQQSFIVDLLSERSEKQDAIRLLENMINRISHTLEGLINDLPVEFNALKNILLDELKQLARRQEILLEEG